MIRMNQRDIKAGFLANLKATFWRKSRGGEIGADQGGQGLPLAQGEFPSGPVKRERPADQPVWNPDGAFIPRNAPRRDGELVTMTRGELTQMLREEIGIALRAYKPDLMSLLPQLSLGDSAVDPALKLNIENSVLYWAAGLPNGTITGQLPVWNNTTGKWQLLDPGADYHVLQSDQTKPLKIGYDYHKVQ